MKNEILPSDYKETLDLIIDKIRIAQQNAVLSANYYLLNLYWDIGNIIVDKKKKARLGNRSNREFIKGFKKKISNNARFFG